MFSTRSLRSINSSTTSNKAGLAAKMRQFFGLLTLFAMFTLSASAQTGGEAGIQGSVVDPSGASIPNATVTATNVATGVVTVRESSSAGLYVISPIIPGTYTVTVAAKGFKSTKQENFTIDALKLTGLNVTLELGASTEEITVTDAPPALETTNATLGATIENSTYSNLPLQMTGQQRDPTAFATLIPGATPGARAPIIGGTGNYLAAVYVDGVPVTTINQQGDNRVVANALPVESIDQFQVVTSSPDAEYQGAGIINFTMKSGTAKYHGSVAEYVRARMFDTYSFAGKIATTTNALGQTVPSPKPDEHQSETVVSGGGPIPFMRKKGFFYVTYDKYHGRAGINPNFLTIPTALMRQGNFSETTVDIYDPTTDSACAPSTVGTSTTTVCRTKLTTKIIPANEQSPWALKMQSYLPTNYANANKQLNYYGGVPTGYQNWEIAGRADFDLTPKQRLSYVIAYGVRKNVPFTVGTNSVSSFAGVVLPLPYTAGGYATITPVVMDIEHEWQITEHTSNQLKFAFNRFGQPIRNLTDGVAPYRAAADLGITGLPAGQAQTELPEVSFTAGSIDTTAISPWTSNGASGATQTTIPNTFTLLDNYNWVKGKHNLTIGATTQWLEDNVAAQLGASSVYQMAFSANSTAAISGGAVSPTATNPGPSGFSYASFLLGAASQNTTLAEQAVSETGGRYHDISPYVEDNWKVRSNLTINIGMRWDYFPPFHEVLDRWSFMNPNIVNPITGNNGALQFAGNHGGPGVSCNCRTPVQTWWKNFGPRVGFSYSVTPTTVIRGGYGLVYSIGGGVGGRGGAGTGTGQTGFNITAASPAEITATSSGSPGPSYYLNANPGFAAQNMNYGGPTYTLPALPSQNVAAQGLLASYYGTTGSTGSGPGYADPYLSGRAPEFALYNFGIQQALTRSLTLTINYAGTQSHFLLTGAANARGYWSNLLDPKYAVALAGVADSTGKNPVLGQPATPANVAIVQAALPGFTLPYAAISSATTKATIAQTLVAFPQYNGLSDTWGQNVGNLSYNALQASLAERNFHGLSYTLNYTWARNIGDDGTFRSGFNLPSGSISRSSASYHMDRIERSLTTTDMTHVVTAYGNWNMPFGKTGNAFEKALVKGWSVSSIYYFRSGTPFVVSSSACNSAPLSGTCEVDLNPAFTGNPRINGGRYRRFNVQYINPAAFIAPQAYPTTSTTLTSQYTEVGNAPRTAPYGLRNPYSWNDDVSLKRSFPIFRDRVKFVAEIDCLNVANHANLSNPSTTWASGSATFGVVTGASAASRDFQFAGHINF